MDYFIWWAGLISVALTLTYVELSVIDWWRSR